jgi:hypothetical protein
VCSADRRSPSALSRRAVPGAPALAKPAYEDRAERQHGPAGATGGHPRLHAVSLSAPRRECTCPLPGATWTWPGPELGEPCRGDGRAVRPPLVPAALPPAWGWAWRSVAGSPSRGIRGRRRFTVSSTRSTSGSRACGRSASSAATASGGSRGRGDHELPRLGCVASRLRTGSLPQVSRRVPGRVLVQTKRSRRVEPGWRRGPQSSASRALRPRLTGARLPRATRARGVERCRPEQRRLRRAYERLRTRDFTACRHTSRHLTPPRRRGKEARAEVRYSKYPLTSRMKSAVPDAWLQYTVNSPSPLSGTTALFARFWLAR